MSCILNDIATNSISLTECLQRLLIITNKTGNSELSEWCSKELIGYKVGDNIPDYRKFKSINIVYSGINGRFQITNQPLLPGYLSEKTIEKVKDVTLFENIAEVEKRKDADNSFSRDLTYLASEVYSRTMDELLETGVQCMSIKQIIPQQFYGDIFSAVKIRVINLLCYYESRSIDLDNLDVSKNQKETDEEKSKVFNKIVVEGNAYASPKKEKRIIWHIIVPIVTAVIGGVVSGVIVYLITNVWM